MTKLEFMVRAFTLQNEALKSLADNQKELFNTIIELKNRGDWVGLTDEEICELWSITQAADQGSESTGQHAFARLIESKLKEKNGW